MSNQVSEHRSQSDKVQPWGAVLLGGKDKRVSTALHQERRMLKSKEGWNSLELHHSSRKILLGTVNKTEVLGKHIPSE